MGALAHLLGFSDIWGRKRGGRIYAVLGAFSCVSRRIAPKRFEIFALGGLWAPPEAGLIPIAWTSFAAHFAIAPLAPEGLGEPGSGVV
jgi:hypothetical protein